MWFLFLFMTIAFVFLSVSTILFDQAQASTTFIVGEWRIEESTVLKNGVWDVNGSIIVINCTLMLDNARISFNSTSFSPEIIRVMAGGQLDSLDSTLEGGSKGFHLELLGDASFINTTVSTHEYDPQTYGIWQLAGNLVARNCTFSDARTLIWSRSNITIEGCEFSTFGDRAVEWQFQGGSPVKTVTIKDSAFQNERHMGLAISVQGARNEPLVRVIISNNTFRNVFGCIYCSDFYSYGYNSSRAVLIEDNTAEMCTNGLELSGSSAIMARNNRWHMIYSQGLSGTVHVIMVYGEGSPFIIDDEITGGRTGILIEGYSRSVELSNISISDVDVGIVSVHAKLLVRDSQIDAKVHDFELQGIAVVRLYDCRHSYRSNVFGSGTLYEMAKINVTSVTWQEGTLIDSGVTIFDDGAGTYLSKRDNHNPSSIDLPTWILTQTSDLRIDLARGVYEMEGMAFYSDLFPVGDVHEIALIIYDRCAPVLTVEAPSEWAKLRLGTLLVRGSCLERGVGMGTVRVRCTGIDWQFAELTSDGGWHLTLTSLRDGTLSVNVNATDQANNSMQMDVGDVTIDTVLPLIDVLSPPDHVSATPVELVVRTEPGSTAYVNFKYVDMTGEGMFSVLLALYEGENGVLISVEDTVGNRNETVHVVVLDTVAPMLRVTSPAEGAWTRDESIWVNGTTEPGTFVSVDGIPVKVSKDGAFSSHVAMGVGESVILILAVDKAGNSERIERRIHVDLEVPMLEILEPADGDLTSERVRTVSGMVADASPRAVLVDGNAAMIVGERWFKELLLEEGPNLIKVEAVDAAGNIARGQLTVVLDTHPPSLDVRLTAEGQRHTMHTGTIVTKDAEAQFELIADENGTVEVAGRGILTVEAGHVTTWSCQMDEGINEIMFSIWDIAGNKGSQENFAIVLDTVAPSVILLFPDNGTVTDRQFVIVKGLTEPGADVHINGVVANILGDGSFEAIVPLKIGINSLLIVVTDEANNSRSSSVTVIREEGVVSAPPENANDYLVGTAGLLVGITLSVIILRLSSRKR